MDIFAEVFFIISVIVIVYSLGFCHIYVFRINRLSLKSSLCLFSLFYAFHVIILLALHNFQALYNPLPFWQWGGKVGGDEINFYRYMDFYKMRFANGDFSFDNLDKTALDFSLWVYCIALISDLMPISEISKYLVPKLVSCFFVSVTCVYTLFYVKSLKPDFNIKPLVIFLLITPDFYHMSSGIFRAPILAYLFIFSLFLFREMSKEWNLLKIGIFTPILILIFVFILPKLKIFLNLFLCGIVFSCLFIRNRWIIIFTTLVAILVLINASQFILELISFFSSDGYGDLLARIFVEMGTGASSSSIAVRLGETSFVLLILANLLQFFLTIPFWVSLTDITHDAESFIETAVFVNNHIMMAFFIPGLIELKRQFGRNAVWLFYPLIGFALVMAITSTVLIRWRFPVMALIVVVTALGYKSRHRALKISYLVFLSLLYVAYYIIKSS